MNEITINEIKRYCESRVNEVSKDVESGEKYAKDPFYARFWEGRLVADKRHQDTLNNILKLISEG